MLHITSEEEEANDKITIRLNLDTVQINFHQLCKHSRLIQSEIQRRTPIDIIISKVEDNLRTYHIKDTSSKNFFKIISNENLEIANEDFSDLYKLSKIFKVRSLKIALQNFAQSSSQNVDFIINLLLDQQSNETDSFLEDFITADMEDILSRKIEYCLQNENFGQLQVSTIFRIIKKSDRTQINSDILYDFIIISIEKRSPLFTFLDIKRLSNDKFNDLCQKNAINTIDFLPNNLLYLKELREENERLSLEITQLREEKRQLQSQILNQNQNSNQNHTHNTANKAIRRELLQYQDDDSLQFTIDTEDDDLSQLRVTLSPPPNTPYEDGIFFLTMRIPDSYPSNPPKVRFETKIYHPNIDEFGDISIKDLIDWKPTYTLKHLIEEISCLLEHPNTDKFLVASIASQYINDRAAFERMALEWTRLYAV